MAEESVDGSENSHRYLSRKKESPLEEVICENLSNFDGFNYMEGKFNENNDCYGVRQCSPLLVQF